MLRLAGTRDAGANHTHLSQLQSEREAIDIGRTTLRRILVNAGLSSPRRRRSPKHRVRRQWMPREGMLIQLDGSHQLWLGDERPPFALLMAVDDATGLVVNARCCDQEDSHNYFLLIQGLLRRYGIPLALYDDRHLIFKYRSKYQPAGVPTQFGRAMAEGPMIKRYPAVYELTPNNYAAYLPDLPGCVTTDGDWAEIQSNIPEAIEFHIQGLIRNHDGAPDAVLSVGDAMSFHIRTIAESDRAAVELETTVGLVDVEVKPPASVEA